MPTNIFEKYGAIAVALVLLAIYVLGISDLSTTDGWGYAADVMNGNLLLRPHHLLYSITGYYWVKLAHVLVPDADVIYLLKLMNTLFASITAFTFFRLLQLMNVDSLRAGLLTIIAGFSWGFLRFSIENETYVIPIWFSISASYFYLKAEYSQKSTYLFYSGLLAATACLYHQVMFFWWLALAIAKVPILKDKSWKPFLLFLSPWVIVPVTYAVALISEGINLNFSNLMEYVLHDYFTGNASLQLTPTTLLLGFINLFRTFFQIHGYVEFLLSESLIWYIPLIISVIALIFFAAKLVKHIKPIRPSRFQTIHLTILLMQVAFAFIAGGNAEFMAMVPFLAVISISGFSLNTGALNWFAVAITLWNLSVGVVPQKVYSSDGSDMVLKSIINNPTEKKVYILSDAAKVINRLEYSKMQKQIIIKEGSIASQDLNVILDSLLMKGYTVYTDCIDKPKRVSRATLIMGDVLPWNEMTGYKITRTDSVTTLEGKVYLSKVSWE